MKSFFLHKINITVFVFFTLILCSFFIVTHADENTDASSNIFEDFDQDGLSNNEEVTYGTDPQNSDTDGDSYSDGIEVQSGYNPLLPAPGDRIVTDNTNSDVNKKNTLSDETNKNITSDPTKQPVNNVNLTNDVSQQVANLIATKSPGEEPIQTEDIDLLINNALQTTITEDDLPEIDIKKIKIIDPKKYKKYKKEESAQKQHDDELEYLTSLAFIVVNNLPYKVSNFDDLESISNNILSQVSLFAYSFSNLNYFKDLSTKAEESLVELYDIPVPETFLDLHIQGLQISEYLVSLDKENVTPSDDPVSMIVQLSKIQGVVGISISFVDNVLSRLKDYGIDVIPFDI